MPSVRSPCSTPSSNSTCMPTQMPSTGRCLAQPVPDERPAAHEVQPAHARGVRPDARHDQAVGLERLGVVLGHRDVGAGAGRAPARPSAGCPSRSRGTRPTDALTACPWCSAPPPRARRGRRRRAAPGRRP
jgi:hypothetical protein